jgi:hypothetical protein
MRLPFLALLLPPLLSAGAAQAQPVPPALAACLDERRPAAARMGPCNEALRLTLPDQARAQALAARAGLRTDEVLARIDARPAGTARVAPPREAFDPAWEDVVASLQLHVTEPAVATLVLLRVWRGDMGPTVQAMLMAFDSEGLVAEMTDRIDRGTTRWEPFMLRGMNRMIIGQAGAEADFAEAWRRIAASR